MQDEYFHFIFHFHTFLKANLYGFWNFGFLFLSHLYSCFFFFPRIDASDINSGLGRYINHLKRGQNLLPKAVKLPTEDKYRIVFLAKETINPGDDLYYDYGALDSKIIKKDPWLRDFKNKGMGIYFIRVHIRVHVTPPSVLCLPYICPRMINDIIFVETYIYFDIFV